MVQHKSILIKCIILIRLQKDDYSKLYYLLQNICPVTLGKRHGVILKFGVSRAGSHMPRDESLGNHTKSKMWQRQSHGSQAGL